MDSRYCPVDVLDDHPKDQFPKLPSVPVSSELPTDPEISRQYIRKPVRCQRTTVSGVTMMRERFQSDEKETSPPDKEAYHHSKAARDEAKHGHD